MQRACETKVGFADFGSVAVVVHPDAGDTPSMTSARAWQIAFGVLRGRCPLHHAGDVGGHADAFDEYVDTCRNTLSSPLPVSR
jgi:hypothetical protein